MVREELSNRISVPTSILLAGISFVLGGAGAYTGVQVGMTQVRGELGRVEAVQVIAHTQIVKDLDCLRDADNRIALKVDRLQSDVDRMKGGKR